MNDMKWIYYLIIVLYVTLISIRILNAMVVKDLLSNTEGEAVKIKVFKKDFFTTIAIFSLCMAIGINLLCFIGSRPFNIQSIFVSIAVVGMALLSGSTDFYIKGNEMILGGYLLKEGEIKEYQIKDKKTFTLYKIFFVKDLNGYESIKMYVARKNKNKIEEIMKKNQVVEG